MTPQKEPLMRIRPRLLSTLAILAALYVSALPLAAQKPASGATPEELTRLVGESVKQKDWAKFAALMHPAALAELKSMFQPIVKLEGAAQMRKTFFGVDNAAQFDALSDEAAFERLMTQLTANIPGMAEAVASSEMFVVGSLPEGDDLVHVVYHTGAKSQGLLFSKTAVMTFRRYQGEWRGLLSGSLEGLAAKFAQMAGS